LITLRHKKIGMNSDTRPEINYTNHKEKTRRSSVCDRCSRPLCSSQKTDGNHHQPERFPSSWPWWPAGQKTRSTRVARFLRTQQRAHRVPSASAFPFALRRRY